jgi:hypothetical protein
MSPARSGDLDFLRVFPETVNVAVGCRVQDAWFLRRHFRRDGMIGVNGTLVCAIHGFTMGREFEVPDLNSEFFAFRFEEKLDPPDVVFRRIGVGDLFPEGDFDLKRFTGCDGVGTFNDGDMFLRFPVRALVQFGYLSHRIEPPFLRILEVFYNLFSLLAKVDGGDCL